MIKYLFASHGKLAEGVKDAVNLIMGPQKNVYTFCAYQNDNNDVSGAINDELKQLMSKPSDQWIVVSDIFGGSVNNSLLEQISQYHFYLVSGLNLPLVLNLLTQVGNNIQNIPEHIRQAVSDTQKQIIFCNDSFKQSASDDNDF